LVKSSFPKKQWAAVRIHLSEITDPPQKGHDILTYAIPACQGQELGFDAFPPTMRGSCMIKAHLPTRLKKKKLTF